MRIITIDDLGVSEDVRDDAGWSSGERINSLNQIMRQDVGGDTWSFSYDLNGNMTGKTNGVDTWTYTWNDENRLVHVQGPGSVDVAYTYDWGGRMLSRDDGSQILTFLWENVDMIRESDGISTKTYCAPEGELMSFILDDDRYDVHTDALGSVRMVTDHLGDIVARFEFDAWGNALASSFDNVPGGMSYSFVGGFGCRKDPSTGLLYMRARHYEPQLRRFLSRDPIGHDAGANLYIYTGNSPVSLNDPAGLGPGGGAPVTLPGGGGQTLPRGPVPMPDSINLGGGGEPPVPWNPNTRGTLPGGPSGFPIPTGTDQSRWPYQPPRTEGEFQFEADAMRNSQQGYSDWLNRYGRSIPDWLPTPTPSAQDQFLKQRMEAARARRQSETKRPGRLPGDKDPGGKPRQSPIDPRTKTGCDEDEDMDFCQVQFRACLKKAKKSTGGKCFAKLN